jgi:hypothetical protein
LTDHNGRLKTANTRRPARTLVLYNITLKPQICNEGPQAPILALSGESRPHHRIQAAQLRHICCQVSSTKNEKIRFQPSRLSTGSILPEGQELTKNVKQCANKAKLTLPESGFEKGSERPLAATVDSGVGQHGFYPRTQGFGGSVLD